MPQFTRELCGEARNRYFSQAGQFLRRAPRASGRGGAPVLAGTSPPRRGRLRVAGGVEDDGGPAGRVGAEASARGDGGAEANDGAIEHGSRAD